MLKPLIGDTRRHAAGRRVVTEYDQPRLLLMEADSSGREIVRRNEGGTLLEFSPAGNVPVQGLNKHAAGRRFRQTPGVETA